MLMAIAFSMLVIVRLTCQSIFSGRSVRAVIMPFMLLGSIAVVMPLMAVGLLVIAGNTHRHSKKRNNNFFHSYRLVV